MWLVLGQKQGKNIPEHKIKLWQSLIIQKCIADFLWPALENKIMVMQFSLCNLWASLWFDSVRKLIDYKQMTDDLRLLRENPMITVIWERAKLLLCIDIIDVDGAF